MTVVELINNLGMVVLIGFMACIFMQCIIHAIGEERRKNFVLSDKVLDKTFDRLERVIKDLVKELKPKEVSNYTTFSNFKKDEENG